MSSTVATPSRIDQRPPLPVSLDTMRIEAISSGRKGNRRMTRMCSAACVLPAILLSVGFAGAQDAADF